MKANNILVSLFALCVAAVTVDAFVPQSRISFSPLNPTKTPRNSLFVKEEARNDEASSSDSGSSGGFTAEQRIESVKAGVVGAIGGGIALTPFGALHDIFFNSGYVMNGAAQWEFDTDMGSLMAALFSIVYRYVVREGDDNPMLKQGVVGAFVFTRTLAKIQVPSYCSAAPLSCGEPLEYFDWSMIYQGVWAGVESVALFGAAALLIEYCFWRNIIKQFKG